MKINTLVIDDNPDWQKILSRLVGLHPLLHLVGTCSSAFEAYAMMVKEEISLLICDIEMPDLSGLSFAKTIQGGPLIIFVTAHHAYALDCYEVSPVDFLIKPIDYERFMKSIEKVKNRLSDTTEKGVIAPYFFIRENLGYTQLFYHDVLYMQAQEHFLEIITKDASYLPILTMTKVEEQLKNDVFIRVHRSFLVNRTYISKIGKNDIVLTNGKVIPIGDQFRSKINRKHIEGNVLSR